MLAGAAHLTCGACQPYVWARKQRINSGGDGGGTA